MRRRAVRPRVVRSERARDFNLFAIFHRSAPRRERKRRNENAFGVRRFPELPVDRALFLAVVLEAEGRDVLGFPRALARRDSGAEGERLERGEPHARLGGFCRRGHGERGDIVSGELLQRLYNNLDTCMWDVDEDSLRMQLVRGFEAAHSSLEKFHPDKANYSEIPGKGSGAAGVARRAPREEALREATSATATASAGTSCLRTRRRLLRSCSRRTARCVR